MAKPDTDDGWTPLAHELLAATLCARIPHEARVVLSFVFLQCYGPAKRKEARLDAVEIAKMTGLKRPNVWRGITFLEDNKMIARQLTGAYRFVKNYDGWGAKGDRLLTPSLSAFSVFAPTLAMSYRHSVSAPEFPAAGGETTQLTRIETDTASTDSDKVSVSVSILPEYPNGYATSINPDTRILIGRIENGDTTLPGGATGDSYQDQKPTPEPKPAVRVLTSIPAGDPDPAMVPPFPDPEKNPIHVLGGPHDLTDAEARDVWRRVWLVSGNWKVCNEFYKFQRLYPAAMWVRAVERAAIKNKRVRSVSFLGCLVAELEEEDKAPAVRTTAKPAAKTLDEQRAAGAALKARVLAKEAENGRR